MGWLPCIRRGSDRWWLPRSPEATDAITQILLSHRVEHDGGHGARDRAENSRSAISDDARLLVAEVLGSDPPLFVYCALSMDQPQVDFDSVLDWLIQNASARFASGDALLGAPDRTPAHAQQTRRLLDHYRSLPVSRWMDDAVLWLEAFGPKVSSTWQHQWPVIEETSHHAAAHGTASMDTATVDREASGKASSRASGRDTLQQLARTMQQLRSMEDSFDARLQKSKLGAIKQLTYGLSHEINNPLANISTRAQSLQRDEEDPARVATLQRIIDQVYRAHEMIADLMFYANPPQPTAKLCNLGELIERVVATFQDETQRQTIRMELSLPDDLIQLTVDETMVGEAVRVLIRNAMEAIGCQGTIVVSLIQKEGKTKIHVADSGPGLSVEARQHAFDPYFSGREAGRGLGLGLCRAYRIARLHHAEISLAGGPAGCVATLTF